MDCAMCVAIFNPVNEDDCSKVTGSYCTATTHEDSSTTQHYWLYLVPAGSHLLLLFFATEPSEQARRQARRWSHETAQPRAKAWGRKKQVITQAITHGTATNNGGTRIFHWVPKEWTQSQTICSKHLIWSAPRRPRHSASWHRTNSSRFTIAISAAIWY